MLFDLLYGGEEGGIVDEDQLLGKYWFVMQRLATETTLFHLKSLRQLPHMSRTVMTL